MKRFNAVISMLAAFATRRMRESEARVEEKQPDVSKHMGRNYWRPSSTFGYDPPVPDVGGVHAYARRHR